MMPDLTGRMAKCAYGDTIKPSDSKMLAFFEYKGPGSRDAAEHCKHCSYIRKAHNYGPYYYPGRCPVCNEDDLFYEESRDGWGCPHCEVAVLLTRAPVRNPHHVPHEFEAHGPYEFDQFYCGCRGWD